MGVSGTGDRAEATPIALESANTPTHAARATFAGRGAFRAFLPMASQFTVTLVSRRTRRRRCFPRHAKRLRLGSIPYRRRGGKCAQGNQHRRATGFQAVRSRSKRAFDASSRDAEKPALRQARHPRPRQGAMRPEASTTSDPASPPPRHRPGTTDRHPRRAASRARCAKRPAADRMAHRALRPLPFGSLVRRPSAPIRADRAFAFNEPLPPSTPSDPARLRFSHCARPPAHRRTARTAPAPSAVGNNAAEATQRVRRL